MIVPIMTYESSTLVNSEKYIGLDVHQATISVAVVDSRGKVVMESILETKATTILDFFAGLRGTLAVTFEEGTWAAEIPMPSRTTPKSTRPGASDRSMVANMQPPRLPVTETDRRRRH